MRVIQKGNSGKIVVNIEPDLKRHLYAALSLSGSTLKDWFRKSAAAYCDEQRQPSFFRGSGYRSGRQKNGLLVREELAQYKTVPESSNGYRFPSNKYTVASMFSGCGGMDLGFTGGFEVFGRRYRSLPFEVVWTNDLNAEACKTYRWNLGHEILSMSERFGATPMLTKRDEWRMHEYREKAQPAAMGGGTA